VSSVHVAVSYLLLSLVLFIHPRVWARACVSGISVAGLTGGVRLFRFGDEMRVAIGVYKVSSLELSLPWIWCLFFCGIGRYGRKARIHSLLLLLPLLLLSFSDYRVSHLTCTTHIPFRNISSPSNHIISDLQIRSALVSTPPSRNHGRLPPQQPPPLGGGDRRRPPPPLDGHGGTRHG